MAGLLWKRGTTLGQGGFGVVSLASTSNALFRGVTLPSLIALKSCNYSASQSLKEEVEILRMFKHSPYIVHCFGANVSFEDNVNLYNLLLEYASGGSLADRLQNCNSLSESEVKKHTKNVLLGDSCIHNKGIIHCDIKPGNILLVGGDRTAKIADFGLSVTLEQGMNQKQGVIRGTERYMAPESVINTEYSPQVDIWALGCTVYELITGTPLWEDADGDGVLDKIEFEEPKFQNSKLSNDAQNFLEKCLVKNPNTRWTADMLLNHTFLSSTIGFGECYLDSWEFYSHARTLSLKPPIVIISSTSVNINSSASLLLFVCSSLLLRKGHEISRIELFITTADRLLVLC